MTDSRADDPLRDRSFFRLPTEHFTIEGRSRAGHETWFRIRELGIALDIGRCPDLLVATPHVLVTHAHLDHAVGIPFYAGQRLLQGIEGGTVVVPAEALADFEELMRIHQRLEGTSYGIRFAGLAPGGELKIARNLLVRAHASSHRVPARGYEVLARRHHLRREFAGLDGAALAALRHEGTRVDEEVEVPLLFYTGDSDRCVLEQNQALFRAEVLMIECSFIAPGHQERAAKYRHIHFDDIAEFSARFENHLIVLTHFSRRYAPREVVETLRKRCPAVLRERIRLAFPEPHQRLD